MAQAARREVGQRRMREQQLARGEAAVEIGRETGARAEEGDLEAERRSLACAFGEPAGGVPPLDAEPQVGAVVAREHERARRHHGGFVGARGVVQRGGQTERGEAQQGAARPHQSSFTAATISREPARAANARAASVAVTTPAASTAASSAPMRAAGTRSSIVQ